MEPASRSRRGLRGSAVISTASPNRRRRAALGAASPPASAPPQIASHPGAPPPRAARLFAAVTADNWRDLGLGFARADRQRLAAAAVGLLASRPSKFRRVRSTDAAAEELGRRHRSTASARRTRSRSGVVDPLGLSAARAVAQLPQSPLDVRESTSARAPPRAAAPLCRLPVLVARAPRAAGARGAADRGGARALATASTPAAPTFSSPPLTTTATGSSRSSSACSTSSTLRAKRGLERGPPGRALVHGAAGVRVWAPARGRAARRKRLGVLVCAAGTAPRARRGDRQGRPAGALAAAASVETVTVAGPVQIYASGGPRAARRSSATVPPRGEFVGDGGAALVRPHSDAAADAAFAPWRARSAHIVGARRARHRQGGAPGVPAEAYFPLLDAYVAAHDDALVFVATDDPRYMRMLLERYGDGTAAGGSGRVVARRLPPRRRRKRARGARAARVRRARRDRDRSLPPYEKARGRARRRAAAGTDFLLKTASGVAEFAMWAAPALGARYLDLQYTDRFRSQPLPPWTRRVPPVDGGGGGGARSRSGARRTARSWPTPSAPRSPPAARASAPSSTAARGRRGRATRRASTGGRARSATRRARDPCVLLCRGSLVISTPARVTAVDIREVRARQSVSGTWPRDDALRRWPQSLDACDTLQSRYLGHEQRKGPGAE